MEPIYDFGVREYLDFTFAGNTGIEYLEAFTIFLISIVVLWVFKTIVLSQLRRLAKRTKTDWDDYAIEILGHLSWPFFIILSTYFSAQFIHLPPWLNTGIDFMLLIGVLYYIARSAGIIIDVAGKKYTERQVKKNGETDDSIINVLTIFLKISIWAIVFIFFLSNIGVNISALIAGMGIGGIAIAFALQNVLSDIFASFSIYFDKPFKKGDFIIIGTDMGVVQRIGIKSTRITTLQGQELIVSNKELTSVRVNNYKRMEKRRVVFSFGVTYDTPAKKLEKIPTIVKDIITKIKLTDIDRVHFQKFGDSSLIYEVVYYVKTSDYNPYMDAQQEINLEMVKRFEKEGIEFAFPTQTLYVNKIK